MLLRPKRQLANICAAFLAAIGILLFAFTAPGTHEPKLHAVEYDAVSSAHSHAHDGHSHDDDLETAEGGDTASDHHHADHTHEKAGVTKTSEPMVRTAIPTRFSTFVMCLTGSPPGGIDRPPRHRTLT